MEKVIDRSSGVADHWGLLYIMCWGAAMEGNDAGSARHFEASSFLLSCKANEPDHGRRKSRSHSKADVPPVGDLRREARR
jgi:hypothetical protein